MSTSSDPLVTIGLPVYNGEALVERAIASVLGQTYAHIEVLISDNCSTDRTEEICRDLAERDPRVVYTRTERNLGAAGNYTRLAQIATGKYFKWISHDDLIDPTFVEQCVAIAEQDPEIITVAPILEIVDADGHLEQSVRSYTGRKGWPSSRLAQYREMMKELAYCETHDDGLIMIAYEYGLHRLELLRRTRLELPFISSDYVLAAELALWGRLVFLDRPLSTFTLSTSSASTSANFVSWDPAAIQRMLDPSRTGRWHIFASLRRRHVEHVRAMLRSPLSLPDKLRAVGASTLPTRSRLAVRLHRRFAAGSTVMRSGAAHPVVLLENGDYSQTSRGDCAMLVATIRLLRTRWPTARIGVVSSSRARLGMIGEPVSFLPADRPWAWTMARPHVRHLPRWVLDIWWAVTQRRNVGHHLARLGMRVLSRRHGNDTPARRSALRPDLTVAVGGGYFCDMDEARALSVLDVLEWAKANGSVTAMTSQGIGPISSNRLLERMAEVLPQVDLIMLREGVTAPRILRELGFPDDRVEIVGDDAIILSAAAGPVRERNRIGLSLRDAEYLEIGESQRCIVEAVSDAAALFTTSVRPITSCEWGDDDRRINRLVANASRRSEGDVRRSAGPDDFASAFRECRVIVTTVYHAAVFALSQGIPVVCVYRSAYQESKYVGLAELFDRPGLTLIDASNGCDQRALFEAIVDGWGAAEQVADDLVARTDQIRSTIAGAYGRLFSIVDARAALSDQVADDSTLTTEDLGSRA